jgi:hypothetical protein
MKAVDKIYILTCNRVDNQITYNHLPQHLKDRVCFVVQAWEREKYNYDADYLVLPEYITLDHPRPVSHSRQYIYEQSTNMTYAMLDDDLSFGRRNAKYWGEEPTMEKSKRKCTEDDISEMFEMFYDWIVGPDITFAGCSHSENPPSGKPYTQNSSLGSQFWINGKKWSHMLPEFKLTETRVAQDTILVLSLLSNGFQNRISQEFCFYNDSAMKTGKVKSDIWDSQTIDTVIQDHKTIEKMFPGIFHILYDENGARQEGGFRNLGKWRCHWSKAYKNFVNQSNASLEDFLC